MSILVINRAIPGSGKSSFSKALLNHFGSDCEVYSTDDLFMVDGKYTYDGEKIYQYHCQTIDSVLDALARNVKIVVHDNCNVHEKYVKTLLKSVPETIKVVQVLFEMDSIDVHYSRNLHGLTMEVLLDMYNTWGNNIKRVLNGQYEVKNYITIPSNHGCNFDQYVNKIEEYLIS